MPSAALQAADRAVESALLSKCGAQDTDRDVLPEVVLQVGEDPGTLFEALRRPIEAARCRVRVAEIIERHRLATRSTSWLSSSASRQYERTRKNQYITSATRGMNSGRDAGSSATW